MKRITKILVILVLFDLAGCLSITPTSNELINQLIIQNNSDDTLGNVVLRVPLKNIIVSTNLILPRRQYVLGFPELENEHNEAILSWTRRNVTYKQNINNNISALIDYENPGKVLLSINSDNQLNAVIMH